MTTRNRLALAVAFVFVGVFGAAAQNADKPLPTDPSLVTGQLDNGVKYIVRKHAVPPGRAVIWIHMGTGSLNETDRQRGIAHYLEHMAFNGSEHFPPGSVVPFFQSLGMQFGRDQNAFTNMEQTTYQLSLPDAKTETLGKGMTFFADVMSGLSLTPAEIDAERQIIQEERRRGLSARQRTSDYIMERISPGSLYGQRDTIGTEATINGVNQQDFKDYYGKWYGPGNATVMVVADADPNEVVKVIKEKFGTAAKKATATPQAPGIKGYVRSFAIVASDPELTSEDIRVTYLEPAHPPTTTVGMYRDDLVLGLGQSAMNRRLEAKVAAGGTSYLSGRVSAGNDATTLYSVELSGRAAPGKWKAALQELSMELQRARSFGFTARELEDVKKQIMSGAERAVETESTVAASALVGRMNNSLVSGEPIMSPKQRLELLKQQLPGITAEEVATRFTKEFDPKAVAFIAVLPSSVDVPTEEQLLKIGTDAMAVSPKQDVEVAHATKLMNELPQPGTLKEQDEHAASQVWSGWLSNNVRMHHRFMDYKKNEATVNITLVGGDLLENADNRGITQAAQLAWGRPATKSLTSTDIRELMTGKKVSVRGGGMGGGGRGGRGGGGGGGAPGTISLTISGSPEELETGFQLAYLLLTQPKIEEAAFTQYKTMARQVIEESMKTPNGLGSRMASSLPYPDDEARTKPITPEQIDKLTLAASQLWLEKLIAESPIEVAVVGDISKDRAVNLATKYLGALSERPRVSPETYLSIRSLKRPAGPRYFEKTLDTPTKQSFVLSGFYGADQANREDVRALGMASRILSTRMVTEVREKAQLVYSIGAASRAATTYPGFGVFSATAPTDPHKAKPLIEKLASMYEEFAKNGPTEEEMDIARKQMANTFEEQVKEPGYWSGRIDLMTYQGTKLDDVVNEPAAYQALTAKQVKDTFAKYYDPKNSIVVMVNPQNAGGADAKSEGQPGK
ncbi:MAG: insulinase family protein [Planctomycetes bacterium]|nr:insulinase family protein [Planctomycetota bacterium]